MKKVLMIAGALYIGGAEKICRDIGLNAKDRYSIDYLVFGEGIGEYEAELEAAGCKIIHAAPPASGHLAFYRYLTRLIRRERYDVIHAHTMFNSGWAMLAGKRCGVPVRIAHSHSALTVKMPFYKRLYERGMRRLILRNATACVACGRKAGERLFGAKDFSQKGILLLNGIDAEAFGFRADARERIRAEQGLEDKFIIGHVGHLASVKNQSFLIRLMPKLLTRRADAFLLLLGEGPDRAALEKQILELGLSDYVRLTGNVSNVNEYLSAMDVFAFPSLYEGLPLSVAEVQANGLPCVISERVPRDVFITDLLTPLPIEDEAPWIEALCAAQRHDSGSYCGAVRQSGLDTKEFLGKVYSLYEGKEA